ncbi:hypothetical protein UFOVP1244_141 [uncultured Caudovirales phage]|uniref:Uncharacterized protein n=1 Tax=uncultured Caudovirales phage TaxID=2100421 RepID=A0A6J5REQ3_9CAUD|nr:hypothetical protein UFOVP1244_141 [uncultured Caudovirales phage]
MSDEYQAWLEEHQPTDHGRFVGGSYMTEAEYAAELSDRPTPAQEEAEAKFLERQDREAEVEWANAHAAKVRTEKIGQPGWVQFDGRKEGPARWHVSTNKEIQDRARLRGAVDPQADKIDQKRRSELLPGIKHFHEREYRNGRISNETRFNAHDRMERNGEEWGR